MTHSSATLVRGRVTAVRGTVLEIDLDGALPPLSAAVQCRLSRDQWITAVVHAHIGGGTVRAIALESTRGLVLGVEAQTDL